MTGVLRRPGQVRGRAPRSAGRARRVLAPAAASLAAALLLLAAAPAAACDVCYGAASDAGLVASARAGVFLLLGITAAVLGGFVAFILHLRHRARLCESTGPAAEWAP